MMKTDLNKIYLMLPRNEQKKLGKHLLKEKTLKVTSFSLLIKGLEKK